MKTLLPKTLLLGAAAAAMSLTAFAASAQTYRGGHNPNYAGYSSGYGYSNGYGNSYSHGQDNRYDRHDNRGWNTSARSYGYDRGHSYDRDDRYGRNDNSTGVALAAGVVGLMLGTALADHGNSYQQPAYSYGYAQPYSYGYSPYYGR